MSMIIFKTGDLLQSNAEALVNTVNTVGVMGKGIALQFKEAFPNNYKAYAAACKRGELEPGKLFAMWDNNLHSGKKFIINFPTKVHWRHPSKYEYIEKGLDALKSLLIKEGVKSVAIPPLGSGNGGLDWEKVKPMILSKMGDLNLEVMVFEPNTDIKKLLQQQTVKKASKLTPARAALLYTLFAFESMGEYSSLFAANKLAYFLQRKGQQMNLQFKPYHYGPYAVGVEKVLYDMNGTYLKGMEQGQAKPFEPLHLNYEKWGEINDFVNTQLSFEDAQRVKWLIKFLAGYTSELSLEILASVDYILSGHPNYSLGEVTDAIAAWNFRKKELFKMEHIKAAYDYLQQYCTALAYTLN